MKVAHLVLSVLAATGNDLTNPAEPTGLLAGGDPTGYEFIPTVGQATKHVIFTNSDHHVIELKWTP